MNTNPVSERLEAELDRVAEARLGRFRAETGGPGTYALTSNPNLRVVKRNGREVWRAYVEWPQVQADGRTTSGEARIVFVETPAWLK